MQIKLHKLAATTPEIKRYMQASDQSPSALARQFGVSLPTAIK